MIGLPTRLLIADRALGRFPAERADDAALVRAHRPWFMLGALGPALGDFTPHELPHGFGAPGRTPHYAAWKAVLEIAVGDPTQSPPLPGVVPTLRTLQQTLEHLTALVRAHDFDGVLALRDSGALTAVDAANRDLATILQQFSQVAVLRQLGEQIGPLARPRIDNPMNRVAPNQWTGRDYLHWKRTGDFAARLLSDARASGDARFVAYALGWQVAYAALLCGGGFVASIAGSVYRTHWWRTRWIANFVDTWTWGFYGRDPAVGADAYDAWPSLCGAGLQRWIEVADGLDPAAVAASVVAEQPLPTALPDAFADWWIGAWTATYAPHDPSAQPSAAPLFTAGRLQVAYLMTWLVLWFQTSGEVIGCNPDPGAPPAACGADPQPPDWDDPTRTNPMTGQPFMPPAPSAHHEPHVGEVVCGAALGLLGLVASIFGAGAIGAGIVLAGIGLVVDGEKQLNWDELECQLHWIAVYLSNGLEALHKLTVLGGFQQPYARELGAGHERVTFDGLSFTFVTAAQQNCRSRALRGPLQPWNGDLLDWVAAPAGAPLEAPVQLIWEGEWWPSAIVDDDAANPGQASILTAPAAFDAGVNGSFGPAVQNALRLLREQPDLLPNWNLDGDRGHGWLTWELNAPYSTPVQAFPEG